MLGSGNWGCAVVRILGWNVAESDEYENEVNMYVYEEEIKGRKLTEIINTEHENVKYLPGHKIPENVIAVPDPAEAAKDADVLVFCLPHQFLPRLLGSVRPVIKPGAVAVSLIKGHVEINDGAPVLGSQVISDTLGVETCVLMGANVANEVARGDFCEATLAAPNAATGQWLERLFDRPTFKVTATTDVPGTELCGGLKNVIALGAGFCDGLELGANSKAAVVRTGLLEMQDFIQHFYPSAQKSTLFESCGVADLITTSYGGRNRKCAEAFAKDPSRGWDEIEKDLLGGQKLQGVSTIREIWPLIEARRLVRQLPLFRQIHRIACKDYSPSTLTEFASMEGPPCPPAGARTKPLQVGIFGCGAWGTTIAKVISANCEELQEFNTTVKLHVREEMVEGRSLCDIINTKHENVKYLPDRKLPTNIVGVPDATELAQESDILIFCLPYQFLPPMLESIKDSVKASAVAVSMLKGHLEILDGKPELKCGVIQKALGIQTAAMSGANIAAEVADGLFSECTLATQESADGNLLALLLHRPFFQIRRVHDIATVDIAAGLCGGLALAGGICDGLGLGGNTKAAIIRVALIEIARFIEKFFPTAKKETMFESCGVADAIAASMAKNGKHRRCAETWAIYMERTHRLAAKPNGPKIEDWEAFAAMVWEDVIMRELTAGGGFIAGVQTLRDIWPLIDVVGGVHALPLLCAMHRVAIKGEPPSELVNFNNTKGRAQSSAK